VGQLWWENSWIQLLDTPGFTVLVEENMSSKAKKKQGRPRTSPARTAWGRWLAKTDKTTPEIQEILGCSSSTVYGLAAGDFMPGRELGWAIEELTDGAVPFNSKSWPGAK